MDVRCMCGVIGCVLDRCVCIWDKWVCYNVCDVVLVLLSVCLFVSVVIGCLISVVLIWFSVFCCDGIENLCSLC